jgi:hypothetical protein
MRHFATLFAAASFVLGGLAVTGCQTDTMGHRTTTTTDTRRTSTSGNYYPQSYDRGLQTTSSYDRATVSGASQQNATGNVRTSGELVPMDRTTQDRTIRNSGSSDSTTIATPPTPTGTAGVTGSVSGSAGTAGATGTVHTHTETHTTDTTSTPSTPAQPGITDSNATDRPSDSGTQLNK